MMRVLIGLFAIATVLNALSPKELFNQIDESKKSLENVSKEKILTNKQLQKIAKKIKEINKEIAIYDKKMKELDGYLKLEQKKYLESQAEIKNIDAMVKELDKDIEQRKKEFAKKLSTQLGSIVAQNKTSQKTEKSIVLKEVYNKYKDYNQQELLKLSKNIEQKNGLRKNLLERKREISKGIEDIKLKRKIYLKQKKEKQKLLKKLAIEQKQYSKKLKDIFKRQTVIRLTLAKLNILKQEAATEAKKRELELKKRIKELKKIKFASKKTTNNEVKISSIKQFNDSYVAQNIYNYKGAKTIPPLKSPKVIKRFGTFIDPIYKIKSHSDSITLISKSSDKRVYNVLNGEVAYVGKSAMLGKLVIIKHNNGLHTIYADLDKISPYIHKGSKVKKGSIIGKVKKKLIFQATKNGALINPIKLINI